MFLILTLVTEMLVASAALAAGYMIEVTDCINPSKVRSYNKESICKTLSPIDEQPVDRMYTVLQKKSTCKIKGYLPKLQYRTTGSNVAFGVTLRCSKFPRYYATRRYQLLRVGNYLRHTNLK